MTPPEVHAAFEARKSKVTGAVCEEERFGPYAMQLGQWVAKQAVHCGQTEQVVLGHAMDGFFEDDFCRERGYPFPFLARFRTKYYLAGRPQTPRGQPPKHKDPRPLEDPVGAEELGVLWQQLEELMRSQLGRFLLKECHSWGDWERAVQYKRQSDEQVPF